MLYLSATFKHFVFALSYLVLWSIMGTAQPSFKNGLRWNLDSSGTHFVQAGFVNQTWLRYMKANANSTYFGQPVDELYDIGLRRTRFVMMGQLSDRVFFYTQFGQNNFSLASPREIGAFFHDATLEYTLLPKEQLIMGAGLTGTGGPARYSNASVSSSLTMDLPLYQQATNGTTDQFIRKLSLYAKGRIGSFDYRAVVSRPMAIQQSGLFEPEIAEERSTFAHDLAEPQLHGYFRWQFWEPERIRTPYHKGTYLGKKKVLNVGLGGLYQSDAMWHSNVAGDTVYENLLMANVDAFMELPLPKQTALTAYLSLMHYDYGQNYLRMVGPMNPLNFRSGRENSWGGGNAAPLIGTGQIAFAQLGYLFPQVGEWTTRFQVYADGQFSDFEVLDAGMGIYNAGLNAFVHGHKTKFTLNYQSYPVIGFSSSGDTRRQSRSWNAVLQFQVAI